MAQNVVVATEQIISFITDQTMMECTAEGGSDPWWPPVSKHSLHDSQIYYLTVLISENLIRNCNKSTFIHVLGLHTVITGLKLQIVEGT